MGGATNKLAVDDHGEPYVQDYVVVDGQAKEKAYQPVLVVRLEGADVEPVLPSVLIKHEHTYIHTCMQSSWYNDGQRC